MVGSSGRNSGLLPPLLWRPLLLWRLLLLKPLLKLLPLMMRLLLRLLLRLLKRLPLFRLLLLLRLPPTAALVGAEDPLSHDCTIRLGSGNVGLIARV